jgi:heme oxygenase
LQIIKVSKGGVTLDNIRKFSHSQYKVMRKAAELEEIRERMSLIADMNAAFHGNKKHIQNLEKSFQNILGNNKLEQALNTPDSDWKSRLSRFKR